MVDAPSAGNLFLGVLSFFYLERLELVESILQITELLGIVKLAVVGGVRDIKVAIRVSVGQARGI